METSDSNDNNILKMLVTSDRQSRIRTGKKAREYLQDRICQTYLESIIPLLKDKKYDEAIFNLLNSIEIRINTNYQLLNDFKNGVIELL